MTRAPTTPEPNLQVHGAYRGWPPRCEQCGWTGVPTQEATPYVNCVRDPDEDLEVRKARHQRTPVTAGTP